MRVPEREEHPAARMRVQVGIASHAGYGRSRKMEREVLRGLLHNDVALDISLRDRQIDGEARDLDPVAVRDRRVRRNRGRGRTENSRRARDRSRKRRDRFRILMLARDKEQDSRDEQRRPGDIAIADQMWAAFVLPLEAALSGRRLRVASEITRELRARKDGYERAALRAASEAADRAYVRVLSEPFAGRTEREIGDCLAGLLRAEGHDEVNFTIVGSGPNGASPHHDTGQRRIGLGDTVVLDFGGGRKGYRSDITRTVHVGASIDREQQRVHDVVRRSQEAGYATR